MAAKNLVTPVGVARWPWITAPDTKWDADGTYRVNLVLKADEWEPFANELLEQLKENLKEVNRERAKARKKPLKVGGFPWEPVIDDEGNETDEVEIKFKTPAKIKRKDGTVTEIRVPVFDRYGRPLKDVTVGSGSLIQVAFRPFFWVREVDKTYGVSLRIRAVMVRELVEVGAGGDASSFGFEVDELEDEDLNDGVEPEEGSVNIRIAGKDDEDEEIISADF